MTEDKLMRLSLVAKQIGVGTSTIVQKLSVHGHKVENNPNAKLNFEQLEIIAKEFAAGSILQESSEGIPKGEILFSRNAKEEKINHTNDHSFVETRDNLSNLKILGKIDLPLNSIPFQEVNKKISNFKKSGKKEHVLNLMNLQLETIPEEIYSLNNLRRLNLSYNEIVEIKKLPIELIVLNLENNLIEKINIPPNIKSLNLVNNRLKSIPDINNLKNLEELFLYGNSIEGIEKTLLGESPKYNCLKSVKNYLNELKRKKIPNRNIKLLLIGNSNVGKSSVLRALKSEPFDNEIKSTHAISLESLSIKDSLVKLQVWDLGGQEIYYGTHRIFMMSPCVQLAVFDSDTESKSVSPDRLKEDEEVRNIKLPYYIKKIEEISPQSKIIIIQSKIEQYTHTPKHIREYFSKYDNLKVSAKNNFKINTLRQLITDVAETVNIYGQDVPYYWESVREYFINNFENDEPLKIIDKQKFREICIQKNVLEDGIDDLLRYLHNTGALYYRDEMQEDIIIDQIWALKVIYKVFDRENDFYKEMRAFSNGKCTIRTLFNDFDKLEDVYSIDQKWIFLRFMQSCGLCFPVKSNPEEILNLNHFLIFPEFLPSKVPSFVKLWNLKNTNKIIFTKKFEFLPYYPLHSVISKLGTKTSFNLLWRNGILIFLDEDNFTGFLIEANFEEHTLKIVVDADAEIWVDALKQLLVIYGDTSKNEWIRQEDETSISSIPVFIVRESKTVEDLNKLEDVKQDNILSTIGITKKKRLVISYAKENLEEVKLLVKYLEAQHIEHWYDLELSNRHSWDAEIEKEFLNADGYVAVISADYLNPNKKYIKDKEIPLIIEHVDKFQKFFLSMKVRSFTMNTETHLIAKYNTFGKGEILPDIKTQNLEATKFMDEFVNEILKTFL